MSVITPEQLTNSGERMIEGNLWGYWAHLAPYHFATNFMSGGVVLDVGCGSGYGAAHLAKHGAKVVAVDGSDVAIAHSRVRYAEDDVTFEVADLNEALPFNNKTFDLVFSSNVFEHIANVDGLAAECARVVSDNGSVIVVVPTMPSPEFMAADMENRFHIHHLPASAWYAKLKRFFYEVQIHGYLGGGNFSSAQSQLDESRRQSGEVTIRETDFTFPAVSLEAFNALGGETIGGLFVCRKARNQPGPETIIERTPAAWREAEVAARLIGRGLDNAAKLQEVEHKALALEQKCQSLSAQISILDKNAEQSLSKIEHLERELAITLSKLRDVHDNYQSSTSWRLTSLLRLIKRVYVRRL